MNNQLIQNNSQSDDSDNQNSTEAYKATQYLLRRLVPPLLYYRMRTFIRQYPVLFLPFSRWRWTRWRQQYCPDPRGPEPAAPEPVMKDTKIVIEGFPRMGNTFAHIAFKMAQDNPVKIGHHTHAAAQIVAAAKMNIPTIVLIRDPESAIISYLIGDFDPSLTIGQSLREYISFYQSILPYKNGYVVATFEDVTTNFGAIIHIVNEKFGTCFGEFQHNGENVQKCFNLIDEGYQKTFGDLSEKVISRPSASRSSLDKELREQFHADKFSKLRKKAYSVYTALIEK